MYHKTRQLHRWAGVIAALFLAVIGVTGFLLATKDSLGWVKPATRSGADAAHLGEVISLDQAARAAFAVGLPELKTREDIERMDYRPEKNVFKVVSREGYHEVQVCGSTGNVLNVARRVDQLTEDIHDFGYFAEWLHLYWLPVIGVILTGLAVTGVLIFFVPLVRRMRYARRQK